MICEKMKQKQNKENLDKHFAKMSSVRVNEDKILFLKRSKEGKKKVQVVAQNYG